MVRRALSLVLFLAAVIIVAVNGGTPGQAATLLTPTAIPSQTPDSGATPTPTTTATSIAANQPSIKVVKVDMFRRIGGEFFSTRQIRIGHIVRWIVYFHLDNPGPRLPSCHIAVSHDGHVFYEDAMWRKRGKSYFFLDGRFRSVYGPTKATFTLMDGPLRVTTELLFKVRLPKF